VGREEKPVRRLVHFTTGLLQKCLSAIKRASLRCGRSVLLLQPASNESLRNFFALMRPVTTEHRLVRIGGDSDGGYLVPDDLADLRTCFSPGVCTTVAFEKDLASRDIRSYMIDSSIESLPEENPLFCFERKFVGVFDGPRDTTLSSWMAAHECSAGDLMLQMDVEGSEFGVILSTDADALRRFRIMVIEFHNLDLVFSQLGCDLLTVVFQRLLAFHSIVHIHPNNFSSPVRRGSYLVPPTMEFTFLRNDRIRERRPAIAFPHPQDRPNDGDGRDYPLPRCWFIADDSRYHRPIAAG
jgi:hypothetical protein